MGTRRGTEPGQLLRCRSPALVCWAKVCYEKQKTREELCALVMAKVTRGYGLETGQERLDTGRVCPRDGVSSGLEETQWEL